MKHIRALFLFACFLIVFDSSPSFGQSIGQSFAERFGGTTRFTGSYLHFIEKPQAPVDQGEFVFTFDHERRVEIRETKNTRLGLELHPYLYGTTNKGNRERQTVFDPRSAFAEFSRKSTWLKAGFMTLKWEGTDGLNPMDIASMKDYSDPLNPQTRASAAVGVGTSGDDFDLEGYYIPQQTRSLLPGERSAWLPRRATFPVRTDEFELLLPSQVAYQYLERQKIGEPRANNFATRAQLRSSYGDVSVAYYEGLADTPAIVPSFEAVPVEVRPKRIFRAVNPFELTPVDYRVRTVAGFYSRPFGQWIFRAAARYDSPIGDGTLTSTENLPSWSQNTIAGFERTFEVGANAVTAIAQYAWVRVPEGNSLLSVRDVFDRTVLFGARYPIGEKWTVLFGGFASTKVRSFYEKLDVSYRFTGNWSVNATLEMLDGPPDSILGVYGKNDRAYVGLSAVY